jgi:hypothetical protein
MSTPALLPLMPIFQANEDIETYVELLAGTGPFRIPIK